MTMTVEQKAARLALIKEVAAKRAKSENLRKRLAAGAKNVRRYTDEVETPKRRRSAAEFDAEVARMDENHNQYTDGSKYLAEHYGERLAERDEYESDWG